MKYKCNPGFRESDYWFFSDGSAEKREEREKRLGGVK